MTNKLTTGVVLMFIARMATMGVPRFFGRMVLCAMALTLVGWHPHCMAQELSKSENDSQQKVIESLVNSLEENYSHIYSVEASLSEVVLNSDPKVLELKSQSGGSITLSFPARAVTNYSIWIKGDEVRRDTLDLEAGNPTETFILAGNKWLQYKPSVKTVWVRRPDQMNVFGQIDIRNLGMPAIGHTLVSLLQSRNVEEVGVVMEADGCEGIVVRTKADHGEFKWVFDPAYGRLPISRESRYEDGSLCDYCIIKYKSVLDGIAWLPVSFDRMNFNKGETIHPDQSKWSQKYSLTVNDPVKINVDTPGEQFVQHPPVGTTVIDVTGEKPKIVKLDGK